MEDFVGRERVSIDEKPLEKKPDWTFTAGETCLSVFFYYQGGVRIEITHDERLIAVGFDNNDRRELCGIVATQKEVEGFLRATTEEAGLIGFELDELCMDIALIYGPEIEHER